MTRICFFGTYDKISLDRILKKLLKKKEIEVIECQESVHSFFQLIKAYISLIKKYRKEKNYSLVFIPWRGIMSLPLVKILTRKKIIYFPYISIFDSLVVDRRKIGEKSIKAKMIKWAEKKACQLSHIVVVENIETKKFFSNTYNIPESKFQILNWGADREIFQPIPIKQKQKIFRVLYFGTYIPFHGVDIIVKAAEKLQKYKDIKFILCGEGQTLNENKKLVKKEQIKNIEFLGHVEFEVLKDQISKSDICLGVFGKSELRNHVFTNKISQILESQKPLITRNVKVMKELGLENRKNCILVEANNPLNLAEGILFLKNNDIEREKIAQEGHKIITDVVNQSWEKFWSEVLYPLLKINKHK
jgi:glycosyltransferase involved in cell wall biosynthesis